MVGIVKYEKEQVCERYSSLFFFYQPILAYFSFFRRFRRNEGPSVAPFLRYEVTRLIFLCKKKKQYKFITKQLINVFLLADRTRRNARMRGKWENVNSLQHDNEVRVRAYIYFYLLLFLLLFLTTFIYSRICCVGVAFLGTIRSVRGTFLRTLVFVFMATFLWLQIHVISLTGRDSSGQASSNETLFALVPQELHR